MKKLHAHLLSALAAATLTPAALAAPLYQELGGPAVITAVVGRVLDRVAHDPRTDHSFKGVKLDFLKTSVGNYVCKVADGPCNYDGETMANSHKDLHIAASEMDLMVQALREELDAAGVSQAAKNELLRRLAPSRRDVVRAP